MKTSDLIFLFISVNFSYSQTAETYFKKGVAKEELKDYKGAIAEYDNAININPKYSKAYYNRGGVKETLPKTIKMQF